MAKPRGGHMTRHTSAVVESDDIGVGTRIGALSHVSAGARLGDNTHLGAGVTIGAEVVTGENVTIGSGSHLHGRVLLQRDVVVGQGAIVGASPGSTFDPSVITVLEADCWVGAGSILFAGITVGHSAVIHPGSVIERPVPAFAIVAGSPARILGYREKFPEKLRTLRADRASKNSEIAVGGAQIITFRRYSDMRGLLAVGESGSELPFAPMRLFFVHGVPSREVRGEHAHRVCHQLLVAAHGACSVVIDDGDSRQEILLDDPAKALYIPPMVWATQYKYTADAVLMVLASHPYDPNDYIRSYAEFEHAARG